MSITPIFSSFDIIPPLLQPLLPGSMAQMKSMFCFFSFPSSSLPNGFSVGVILNTPCSEKNRRFHYSHGSQQGNVLYYLLKNDCISFFRQFVQVHQSLQEFSTSMPCSMIFIFWVFFHLEINILLPPESQRCVCLASLHLLGGLWGQKKNVKLPLLEGYGTLEMSIEYQGFSFKVKIYYQPNRLW